MITVINAIAAATLLEQNPTQSLKFSSGLCASSVVAALMTVIDFICSVFPSIFFFFTNLSVKYEKAMFVSMEFEKVNYLGFI